MYVLDDIINAIGAYQASQQQQAQVRNAQGLMGDVYNQGNAAQQPWLQGGQQSLAQLLQELENGSFNTSITPETVADDPGYQFQMQQAQQALERSAAAKGGLNSGAFAKGLTQYSQGLAGTQYQNAWQRQFQGKQARFGNLLSAAGMGQMSAQNLGQLGQGYSNSMAGLYGALGNSQAAGTMGVTNGISGAFKSYGNLTNQNIDKILGLLSGGGGGNGGGGNLGDLAKLLGGL